MVATCRDELAISVIRHTDYTWKSENNFGGVSFSAASLGGMLLLGKRGLASALSHAPKDENGKMRVVFYAFPHVGVHQCGDVGRIRRIGLTEDSTICGALLALLDEMKNKSVDFDIEPLDIEYSHLKHRLLSNIPYGHVPSPSELTMIAYKTILQDLEELLTSVIREKGINIDYGIFSGVQVHTPDLKTSIWPGDCYAIVDGKRVDLTIDFNEEERKRWQIE